MAGHEDSSQAGPREPMRTDDVLETVGIDGIAIKPSECDLQRAIDVDVDLLTIDYEGHDHQPDVETLASVAGETTVRVTTPVRADGFDPLGDDSVVRRLPESVGRILVAGHPTYLTAEERRRAIAPRLRAARDRSPAAWVGTESIERVALAAGGTQFELLSRSTEHDVGALRAAGFDGEVAVYAPTVLTDDEDAILDAVGAYVARRRPVAAALPENAATDASAEGQAREILTEAAREYALAGSPADVRRRIERLRNTGIDVVVGYPARGLDPSSD